MRVHTKEIMQKYDCTQVLKVHWQLSLGASRPKLERYQKIFKNPHYVYIDVEHSPKTLNNHTNRTALQYVQMRCREMS